jgi:hypothetical protein
MAADVLRTPSRRTTDRTTPNRWPAVNLLMRWVLRTLNVEAREIIRGATLT